MTASSSPLWFVLVEGESDRIALETSARKCGFDLGEERVYVVSMGRITNLYRNVKYVQSEWANAGLAGLYDEGEASIAASALGRSGLDLTSELETLGFFACRPDLEYELIRAFGPKKVKDLIVRVGEGPSLDRMRNQPQWRDGALVDQLHRFMGSQSGRKARYAKLLVEAVQPESLPTPLLRLFRHVGQRR